MRAGSVILVPGEVSQTAPRGGVIYQITPGNNAPSPPPVV